MTTYIANYTNLTHGLDLHDNEFDLQNKIVSE